MNTLRIVSAAILTALALAALILLATGCMLVAGCGQPMFAATAKPVLTLYVTDNCPPCRAAKSAFDAADELPFTVEVKSTHPAWVTILPTLVWETPDGPRRIDGWPGLPEVLAKYHRSQSTMRIGGE